MKKFFLILFLISSVSLRAQQQDSLFYFSNSEVLILANKIQLIRDSLKFKTAIVYEQDSLLTLHQQRSLVFKDQLQNKNTQILILEQQNQVLKESVELLTPTWYDNKLFWFGNGVAVTLIAVLLIK
jgi:hypothetical protein